jgi:RHS repeat-associated protein
MVQTRYQRPGKITLAAKLVKYLEFRLTAAKVRSDGNETKLNMPSYMIRSGRVYKLVTDQIGSLRMVIDVESGSIAQQMEYDEFGQVLTDTHPGFQPFGFAGGVYDPDTHLVQFGARDYDPETGRWISKDPILFAGGDTNLYGYDANDPINFVDPNGLWGMQIGYNFSALLGAFGGSASGGLALTGQGLDLGSLSIGTFAGTQFNAGLGAA